MSNNKSTKLRYNKSRKSRYNKSRKSKKVYIRRNKNKKGGVYDKVKCCMCEKDVNTADTLIPRECLNKYGTAAHRICQKCWWDDETGFAQETMTHKCPGCRKGIPLTKRPSRPVIDLTEDE